MALVRDVKAGQSGRIMVGRVLVEALMWSVVSEVAHTLVNDGAGVSLVVDQQSVGVLLEDAANEPLGIAVRSWCARRNLDHIETFGGEDGIESGGERGALVADQEAKRGDPLAEVHQQVSGGSGGPARGRWAATPSRCTRRTRTSMTNKTLRRRTVAGSP